MTTLPYYRAERIELDMQQRILDLVVYFSLFNYPLLEDEIYRHMGHDCRVKEALNELVRMAILKREGEFIAREETLEHVANRKAGNERARKRIKLALRIGRFIGRFPFVRSVCISGSLSKGFLSRKGDFDYFIMCEPGRLWISRSLLVAFKKLFLFNSKRLFCVNYFIDTGHLEIEDKNVFTAIEIQTLIPCTGASYYADFLKKNDWINDWLYPKMALPLDKHPNTKTIERMIRWMPLDRLDRVFMRLTLNRWKKKFAYFTDQDFELALRTRSYVSKHHPNNFQDQVLKKFTEQRLVLDPNKSLIAHG